MSRHFFALLIASLVSLAPWQARAFSLLGEKASWMAVEIGYFDADVGGPMYLGEGYRYNMPVLTYAYDASFLRHFGANGVAAIESAMKVLNDLPAADNMSATLEEFPLNTLRHNATASAMGMIDLKTTTLSYMLEQLGVASPETYVWSLRAHVNDDGVDFFSVINPNYDPVTLTQTNAINGNLFTYQIIEGSGGGWKTANFPVDPLAPGFTTVANFVQAFNIGFNVRGGGLAFAPGVFFPALTREDVGTFRHLLSTTNYAVESLLPDVTASTGGALGVSGGSSVGGGGLGGGGGGFSGGFGSPWSPVFSVVAGAAGSNPWSIVVASTNVAITAVVVTPGTGLLPVVNGLRPGVGKHQFVQIGYDSILGAATRPYTVTWVDRYVTNGTLRAQAVARQVTVPDFLFQAGDLGLAADALTPIFSRRTVDGFINNSDLNRVVIGNADVELAGPGIMTSAKLISFSKVGRYYLNMGATGQAQGSLGFNWGSFDGSTNLPVVYPIGTSIRGIEDLVRRGR